MEIGRRLKKMVKDDAISKAVSEQLGPHSMVGSDIEEVGPKIRPKETVGARGTKTRPRKRKRQHA